MLRGEIRKRIYSTITLKSYDKSYKILMAYLIEKGFIEGSMTHVRVQKKNDKHDWLWWYNTDAKKSKKSIEYELVPSPGNHIFKYQGARVWVS